MRWLALVLTVAACGSRPEEPRQPTFAPPPGIAEVPSEPADAAIVTPPIDAAAASPFDPASLPLLPVTDHTSGMETEVFAVDISPDYLISSLWVRDPLLEAANAKPVRGHLVALSSRSAAIALLAEVGTVPHEVGAVRGRGATISLSFGAIPQRDLFRLIGETLRINIIRPPGALPDLDLVFVRAPADGLLDTIAAFDGLAVTRSGPTFYLLPKGTKLPALPKLAAAATITLKVITLKVFGATTREATAAVAAIAAFPTSCATTPLTLAIRRVLPAELARAIEVTTGEPLASGSCPIAELATVDPAKARLVAVASAGIKRAAIVTVDGTPGIVRAAGDIEIFDDALAVKGVGVPSQQRGEDDAPIEDDAYEPWRSRIARTAAVVRAGSDWRAYFETTKGRFVAFDPKRGWGMPKGIMADQIEIGPAGVTFTLDGGRKELIPLRPR